MTTAAIATLTVRDLHAGYTPGIDVLQGIDLSTRDAGITAVIGPNGAGKSTLLRAIFGFIRPTGGTVSLGDAVITGLAPHAIKSKGMSYIAQGITIFSQLTVEENLLMGAWTIRGERKVVQQHLASAYELFPALRGMRLRKASELSGGQAKMLSIARETMTDPRVILVDEPTAGLSPILSDQVYEFLTRTQRALGCAIVLVDQNIDAAVAIADRVYLLNLGRVKTEGPREAFGPERVGELIRECLTG
jgi:ABC-type branched-subunit amino acid transport system ATPase component